MTPKWQAWATRSTTLSVAKRTSYKVTWHQVNHRIQKKPMYELSSVSIISGRRWEILSFRWLTLEAIDLVLLGKSRQIGYEEQIEEELNIGGFLIMPKLWVVEQGFVTGFNWSLLHMQVILCLSLMLC